MIYWSVKLSANKWETVQCTNNAMWLQHALERMNNSFIARDKPAWLIIRLLFEFVSDSVFVKLNKTKPKYKQILGR